MAAQGKIQEGLATLQGQIESALSNQNYSQAWDLQNSVQLWQRQENEANRAQDQQAFELQKLGFDYTAIQEAIKNGEIAPDVAADFITKVTKDLGIKIQKPDPNATAKEIIKDQQMQQLQYAFTNTDKVSPAYKTNGVIDQSKIPKNPDGTYNLQDLFTKDGLKAYTTFVNDSLFGGNNDINSLIQNINNGKTSIQELRGPENQAKYAQALKIADKFDNASVNGNENGNFKNNVPPPGTLFNFNGVLYQSGAMGKIGKNEFIWATDVDTGKTYKLIANLGISK